MEINITKPVQVNAKTFKICSKIRDGFCGDLVDQDGKSLRDYEGYIPDFFPGEHYGDYLILDIDMDTGMITNWPKIKAQDVEDFINAKEDE